MSGQVDRTQAAVFIRAKPLLPAGVGGLQLIEMGNGVVAVGRIQKQDPRLTVVVSGSNNFVEQFRRIHFLPNLITVRVYQFKFPVIIHRPHELIRCSNRDVEVGDISLLLFAVDEKPHIGMGNLENGHVGPTADASLGDHSKRGIIRFQKADRAGGTPPGALHKIAPRPEAGKRKTISAAGLLDQGRHPKSRENSPRLPPQVILDGQDETGRQLSQGSSRSRPGWRIGYEEEIGQKFEENFRNFSRIIPELLLGHCDPGRDPLESLSGSFDRVAILAFPHITADKDLGGVFRHSKIPLRQRNSRF